MGDVEVVYDVCDVCGGPLSGPHDETLHVRAVEEQAAETRARIVAGAAAAVDAWSERAREVAARRRSAV